MPSGKTNSVMKIHRSRIQQNDRHPLPLPEGGAFYAGDRQFGIDPANHVVYNHLIYPLRESWLTVPKVSEKERNNPHAETICKLL